MFQLFVDPISFPIRVHLCSSVVSSSLRVQDQRSAVDDVTREQGGEIALLGGRQIVVEHDHIDVQSIGFSSELGGLALSDEERRVWRRLAHEHGCDWFRAGGVCQQCQLGQADLGLAHLPRTTSHTDEVRPLPGDLQVGDGGGETASLPTG